MKTHGGGIVILLDSFEIVNNECEINSRKFFIKDIFIDGSYQICIASGHKNLKNASFFLWYLKFELIDFYTF